MNGESLANPRFQFTIWQLIKLVVICGVVAAFSRSDHELLSVG